MDDWVALLLVGVGVAVGVAVALNYGTRQTVVEEKSEEPVVYRNEQVYEWVDWRGKKRKLTVHRKVERA